MQKIHFAWNGVRAEKSWENICSHTDGTDEAALEAVAERSRHNERSKCCNMNWGGGQQPRRTAEIP